jgi:uncharacterized protein YneF (UPF0154 family)
MQKTLSKPTWILLMLGASAILLFFGYKNFQSVRYLSDNGLSAEGVVKELVASVGAKQNYRPKISFTTKTGQKIEFTHNVSTNPPAYHVGESVPLLYDPANPNNVRIDTMWGGYGGTILMLIVGLMFGLAGIVMIFGKEKISNNPPPIIS